MNHFVKRHPILQTLWMLFKLFYDLDDLKSYLEKYSSIVHDINILERSFSEIRILKPIFCGPGPVLSGIHIVGPFNTKSSNYLTYEILLQAFSVLYKELCEIDVNSLMQTKQQLMFSNKFQWLFYHFLVNNDLIQLTPAFNNMLHKSAQFCKLPYQKWHKNFHIKVEQCLVLDLRHMNPAKL